MPIDVTSDAIALARPPDEVTAYAFDPAHDPDWIGGIREVQLLTSAPIAVGSRVRRIASFLGRRIEYVMEVVELVPGRRLAMHAVESPFPMDVTYEFEPAAGGASTIARIHVQGEANGMYRVAGPLLGGQVKRSVTGDLRRLKAILEGHA